MQVSKVKICTATSSAQKIGLAKQYRHTTCTTKINVKAAINTIVPETVLRFLENRPHVYLEIQEGTMDFLLERLKLGKLDLLVGRLDNYAPDGDMKSQLLYRDPIRIVARQGHPLSQKIN